MEEGISLIILGLIAASSLLITFQKNSTKLLHKIVPALGWIGLLFFFWGLYGFIFSGILETFQKEMYPLRWWTLFFVNLMHILIGCLLGYTSIAEHVFSESREVIQRGEKRLLELARLQSQVGIAGVIMGAGSLLIFKYL